MRYARDGGSVVVVESAVCLKCALFLMSAGKVVVGRGHCVGVVASFLCTSSSVRTSSRRWCVIHWPNERMAESVRRLLVMMTGGALWHVVGPSVRADKCVLRPMGRQLWRKVVGTGIRED